MEELKLSLSTKEMNVYTEYPEKSTLKLTEFLKKLTELISEFSKIKGLKVNKQRISRISIY